MQRRCDFLNRSCKTEWAKTIWNVCRHEDLVTPLKVWTDGNVEAWRNAEAFEMSVELTEEKAKEIISNLLRCGDIELPEAWEPGSRSRHLQLPMR